MGTIHQIRLGPGQVPEPSEILRFRASDGTYYVPDGDLAGLRGRRVAFQVVRALREESLPVRILTPFEGAASESVPVGARSAVFARLLAEDRADGDVNVRFLGRHRTVPADGFVLDRVGGERRYVWQVVPSADSPEEPLSERFRALRARFQRPDTRIVLSLGSGGLKLFGHAPVLRLLERIGCADQIDEVWGTSAGALVALLYCHGLSPEAIEQTGYDLYGGRYRLEIRPSKLRVLRELLREALLPQAVARAGRPGFVDCARGLSRMLDLYCSEIRPVRAFYSVAFNLEDCRTQILTPDVVPPHLASLLRQTDPREAALASCAVPLMFVPRRVRQGDREIPYIDGSTTEDVPLHSVVRKWDLDRQAGVESRKRLLILYVKLSSCTSGYRSPGGRIGKLRLLQTVASAGIQTLHERDLQILSSRQDVELLPLRLLDSGAEFFAIDRIPEYIRAAKEVFPAQLDEIEQRLRDLHGDSTRS